MRETPGWKIIKEAIQVLGGEATYKEITEYILTRWPDKNVKMILTEIIACTVNHKSRVHYKTKRERIANRPYDFLYQPTPGVGRVEWYEPEKHGLWGNKLGADGQLHVRCLDQEEAATILLAPQPPKKAWVSRASHESRAERLANALKRKLELSEPLDLRNIPSYQSLPLCILAAVFLVRAARSSTTNVVEQYCRHYGIKEQRVDLFKLPPKDEQEPVSAFVEKITRMGSRAFATDILGNLQLASPRSKILKSEVALRLARTLRTYKVEYLQDVGEIQGKASFENAILSIPGQGSGIVIRYFYTVAGLDSFVKPDWVILRFLRERLGRTFSKNEAQVLLGEISQILKSEYPYLTTNILSWKIWLHQRRPVV